MTFLNVQIHHLDPAGSKTGSQLWIRNFDTAPGPGGSCLLWIPIRQSTYKWILTWQVFSQPSGTRSEDANGRISGLLIGVRIRIKDCSSKMYSCTNIMLNKMIVVQLNTVQELRDKRPQIFIVLIHFHLSEAWSGGEYGE